MYCPECGSEYREGFTHCTECDVDLVPEAPQHFDAAIKLVKVFETGNPALIPVVESLLDEAGVAFLTKNENLQDMFGGGRLGSGFSIILGPVQFLVREEDVPAAQSLLEDLEGPVPEGSEPAD